MDKFTNQVSIHDVLEEMTVSLEEPAPDFSTNPGLQHNFQIVSYWRRSNPDIPEKGRCRVRTMAPRDPQSPAAAESDLTLDTHPRTRSILSVSGIPYRGPGTYYIIIEAKDGDSWNIVTRLPIELHVTNAATGEPASATKKASPIGETAAPVTSPT